MITLDSVRGMRIRRNGLWPSRSKNWCAFGRIVHITKDGSLCKNSKYEIVILIPVYREKNLTLKIDSSLALRVTKRLFTQSHGHCDRRLEYRSDSCNAKELNI
jgi:hypothetical protein